MAPPSLGCSSSFTPSGGSAPLPPGPLGREVGEGPLVGFGAAAAAGWEGGGEELAPGWPPAASATPGAGRGPRE